MNKVIRRLHNSFIGRWIPQNVLNQAVQEQLEKELKKKDKKGIRHTLKRQRTFFAKLQIDELDSAIRIAEDPYNPQRYILYAIYKEIMRDGHLRSQIRTNILKVVGSPFAVFKKGTEEIDDEATQLLQTAWFEKYRKLFHETPYWGHTLCEFPAMVKTDEEFGPEMVFKDVNMIWREHVKPETGEILLYPQHTKGIPYRERMKDWWLVEMGDPDDIGLLHIAARDAIWKRYSRSDWSRHSERFGMPMLAIKTATKDEKELDKVEEMAANFGNNLYVILDDMDEVEIKESNMQNPYQIYKEKVLMCNQEMSKLISGQTGTTDEKSYVGSAEVHEDILNEYIEAAMRSEMYYHKDVTFPFLIERGYPLKGLEFRYLAFNKEEDKDQDNPGDQEPDDTNKNPGKLPPREKKKTVAQLVADLYASQPCCEHETEAPRAVADLDKIINSALRKVYDKRIARGDVDADWVRALGEELWSGVRRGYDKPFSQIEYGSADYNMLRQLSNNVHVFSAFKNHHNILELHDALTDETGKIRSFSEFKKAAAEINERYNVNWLQAEYNQAIASARMASNWVQFEENKDILPYLQYRTQRDGRVRESHKLLDGVTLPVDHAFWNKWYPPNGWNCRCDVIQVAGPEKKADKGTPDDVPEMFKTNVAKTGQIYNDKHAYFQVAKEFQAKAQNNFGVQIPDRPLGVGVKYKKAATIQEAEELARKAGIARTVSYRNLDVEIANRTNRALIDMRDKTGFVYDEVKAITLRGRHAPYVPMQNHALRNRQTGKIMKQSLEINRAYFSRFGSIKEINDKIKFAFQEGHWIPESVEGLVHHEFGHRLTIQKTSGLNPAILRTSRRTDVSKYGATDLDETLAEIFAVYMKGGKMKREWVDLFNKYSEFKI